LKSQQHKAKSPGGDWFSACEELALSLPKGRLRFPLPPRSVQSPGDDFGKALANASPQLDRDEQTAYSPASMADAATPTRHIPQFPPQIGLGVGLLAISAASILIRFAQKDGAASLTIAAFRLTIATLFLLPVALSRHRADLRALTRRAWQRTGLAGAFLGLHFGLWINSLAFTSVASSVVLTSTAPIFVALISVTVWREKLPRALVIGMIAAMAGGVVVGVSDACGPHGCPPLREFLRGQAFLGDALALASAVALAGYYSLGRSLRATMSLVPYSVLSYGSAAAVVGVAALIARTPVAGFAPRAYVWFLLLALIPQLVGYTALNWALKYLPATYVAVTVLGEPIGATLLAMLLLAEFPSALKLIGSAMILAGILVASLRAAPPAPG
jgi:drug/metabolite transporter (DMT)-like permease